METKVCSKCKKEFDVSFFTKKKSHKDGLSSNCKDCTREAVRKHYYNNKGYYLDKNKRKRKKVQEWFKKYRETLQCEKCSDSRWYVLDFHHNNDDDKKHNVAKFSREAGSYKRLLEEIEKCSILCSNCHRELHYLRRTAVSSNG